MSLQKVLVRLYLEFCPGYASLSERNCKGLQGRPEEKSLFVKSRLEDLGLFSVVKETMKGEGR